MLITRPHFLWCLYKSMVCTALLTEQAWQLEHRCASKVLPDPLRSRAVGQAHLKPAKYVAIVNVEGRIGSFLVQRRPDLCFGKQIDVHTIKHAFIVTTLGPWEPAVNAEVTSWKFTPSAQGFFL